MLNDSYKLFVESASKLPGFKPGTKEQYHDIQLFADGYLRAQKDNNKDLMESYLSASVVRYWYMIPYLQQKSVTLKLEYDDIISWVYLGILKAYKYHGWVDDFGNKIKSQSAEKCINRCLDSIRANAFQESNRNSRKINYMTYSLDESIEVFGDSAEGLFIEDNDTTFNISHLVYNKLMKNDVLSAVILDSICFNDCFLKNKFSTSKLVSGITDNYIETFKKRYNTSSTINKSLLELKSSRSLSKKIKMKLDLMKQDKEILACFQM